MRLSIFLLSLLLLFTPIFSQLGFSDPSIIYALLIFLLIAVVAMYAGKSRFGPSSVYLGIALSALITFFLYQQGYLSGFPSVNVSPSTPSGFLGIGLIPSEIRITLALILLGFSAFKLWQLSQSFKVLKMPEFQDILIAFFAGAIGVWLLNPNLNPVSGLLYYIGGAVALIIVFMALPYLMNLIKEVGQPESKSSGARAKAKAKPEKTPEEKQEEKDKVEQEVSEAPETAKETKNIIDTIIDYDKEVIDSCDKIEQALMEKPELGFTSISGLPNITRFRQDTIDRHRRGLFWHYSQDIFKLIYSYDVLAGALQNAYREIQANPGISDSKKKLALNKIRVAVRNYPNSGTPSLVPQKNPVGYISSKKYYLLQALSLAADPNKMYMDVRGRLRSELGGRNRVEFVDYEGMPSGYGGVPSWNLAQKILGEPLTCCNTDVGLKVGTRESYRGYALPLWPAYVKEQTVTSHIHENLKFQSKYQTSPKERFLSVLRRMLQHVSSNKKVKSEIILSLNKIKDLLGKEIKALEMSRKFIATSAEELEFYKQKFDEVTRYTVPERTEFIADWGETARFGLNTDIQADLSEDVTLRVVNIRGPRRKFRIDYTITNNSKINVTNKERLKVHMAGAIFYSETEELAENENASITFNLTGKVGSKVTFKITDLTLNRTTTRTVTIRDKIYFGVLVGGNLYFPGMPKFEFNPGQDFALRIRNMTSPARDFIVTLSTDANCKANVGTQDKLSTNFAALIPANTTTANRTQNLQPFNNDVNNDAVIQLNLAGPQNATLTVTVYDPLAQNQVKFLIKIKGPAPVSMTIGGVPVTP